jgi:integrase
MKNKPEKPYPDFPLFAHASGQWAKKIKGKFHYFGPWADSEQAMREYEKFIGRVPCVKKAARKGGDSKPYPTFPLYAHSNGQWAKKIRGKIHYFGSLSNPNAALTLYLEQKDALEHGRRPVVLDASAMTVRQMVYNCLAAKKLLIESGELTPSTWRRYERYGEKLITVVGASVPVNQLTPKDFENYRKELQKTHKRLEAIRSGLRQTKAFFNWAEGEGYINKIRFGSAFKEPGRLAIDRARAEAGDRVFTPTQLQAILDAARPVVKAMILLGVNCGFGNMDCATLPWKCLDLKTGWVNYPRTKNGIPRRAALWQETQEAIRAVKVKSSSSVFITKYGNPWEPDKVGHEFEKTAVEAGLTREDADFYDLRRTCASVGVQTNDDDAVRTILGHKRNSSDMLAVYNRMSVSDTRLLNVSNHIHDWLFTGG